MPEAFTKKKLKKKKLTRKIINLYLITTFDIHIVLLYNFTAPCTQKIIAHKDMMSPRASLSEDSSHCLL